LWLSQPCQARRCEKRFISGPQQCSCMQGTAHERLLPSCNHSGTAPGIHSHSASYQLRPDGIQLVVELLHLRLLPRLIQHLGKLARNASAHPSAPRLGPLFRRLATSNRRKIDDWRHLFYYTEPWTQWRKSSRLCSRTCRCGSPSWHCQMAVVQLACSCRRCQVGTLLASAITPADL